MPAPTPLDRGAASTSFDDVATEDFDWPAVLGPNGIVLLASDKQRNVLPSPEHLCGSDLQDADAWMDLALEEPDNRLLRQILKYAAEKRVSLPAAVALTRGLLTDEDEPDEKPTTTSLPTPWGHNSGADPAQSYSHYARRLE